jgi:hypothetical protein
MSKVNPKIFERKWVHIVYYALLIMSTLVIILTQIPGIGNILKSIMSDKLIGELRNYKPELVIPSAIILATFPYAPALIKKISNNEPLNVDSSSIILSSIDAIVNHKLKHISKYMSSHGTINHEDILRMINPDEQIGLLFLGLYNFFNEAINANNSDLNICVIECSDGEFVGNDFYDYHPFAPACTLSALKERSIALNVLKKKSPDIIENTETHPEFVPFDDTEKNKGSMLCFPITNVGPAKEVIFIVSLFSNEPGFFVRKKKKYYNKVIDKYSERIILEYQFKLLKKGGTK